MPLCRRLDGFPIHGLLGGQHGPPPGNSFWGQFYCGQVSRICEGSARCTPCGSEGEVCWKECVPTKVTLAYRRPVARSVSTCYKSHRVLAKHMHPNELFLRSWFASYHLLMISTYFLSCTINYIRIS